MSRFPHLTANGNESAFPDVSNVKTYKYDNTFDYSRFDSMQMNITLCKVPWDMGEAHIGNRTISGIGNVVHFGSKEARNAWFDALPDEKCFRFATKLKQLHRDNYIDVPIPFDVAAKYNYIAVHSEPFANAESFVMYEDDDGLRDWFWFVREVEFLSPNTTRLHLMSDAWQTFIYDINIPYMFLERGHAPMVGNKATKYLSNPISNCSYLLEREAHELNPPRITTKTSEYVFNDKNIYAVFVTTSNPAGSWGSKTYNNWNVPSVQVYVSGVPAYYVFAVPVDSLKTFLTNISGNYPQFLQTVQGVFFVSEKLLDLQGTFYWAGTNCRWIHSSYKAANVCALTKADFMYPPKYAEIAKLYTYPYSVILLTDSEGNETEIRVEDTNGKIDINFNLNLVYPWLNITGSVTSVGKSAFKQVKFKNIDDTWMPIKGNWNKLLFSLDVPIFAVTQSAAETNDYATHFDRRQQDTAAANAQANQNATASNIVSNAGVTTAANSAVTAAGNASAGGSGGNTFAYNIGMSASANQIIEDNATSTIQANEQQATIAAASGVATSVVSGIASGNPAQAAAGIINGLVGGAATLASMNVGNALTATQADNAKASNNSNSHHGNTKTYNDTQTQITASDAICAANNTATSSHAANDSATMIANATRDRSTVTSSIANQINQAALGSPSSFGDLSNGDHATNRPLALFANVITQDDYTIGKCGDEFLRYGYTCNCEWDFNGDWCPMEHFTYWKLADFWIDELQVPDMYVDRIRFFLFGGVTVWKNPDDIGRVTLYENYS